MAEEFIAASCRRSCCVAKAVDKVLTNIPWEDRNSPGAELRITRSPVNPTEARNVMNRLILACERQCAPPLNVRSMEGVRQLVQVAPRYMTSNRSQTIGILRLGTLPMRLHSLPKYAQWASRQ